jgi:hypothetical protein
VTAKSHLPDLKPAQWRRRAEVQRTWRAFVASQLRPLGITEDQVLGLIGRGFLGDLQLSSGATAEMIQFHSIALDLGIKLPESRRIPAKSYFDDRSEWPWLIDRTPAFGDALVALYDILAARIPPERHARAWGIGIVKTVYNRRAAQLTADTANALGCTHPERPLMARDILSRVQRRGRRSLDDRRDD